MAYGNPWLTLNALSGAGGTVSPKVYKKTPVPSKNDYTPEFLSKMAKTLPVTIPASVGVYKMNQNNNQ